MLPGSRGNAAVVNGQLRSASFSAEKGVLGASRRVRKVVANGALILAEPRKNTETKEKKRIVDTAADVAGCGATGTAVARWARRSS